VNEKLNKDSANTGAPSPHEMSAITFNFHKISDLEAEKFLGKSRPKFKEKVKIERSTSVKRLDS
jgi:hypothetical protein